MIVAGSQGQVESGMARIARGEHKLVKLRSGDAVMISAVPIPGYEEEMHALIDGLAQKEARVIYTDIMEDLHVSGHGSQYDLQLLMSLTKAKYLLPIGGTYRQMIAYRQLAFNMGYEKDHVLLPEPGEMLEFSAQTRPFVVKRIDTQEVFIDGLGIGDVGKVVLRDRKTLATEGIVVIIVPVQKTSAKVVGEPDIISRGFVYMKESGFLVDKTKTIAVQALKLRKPFILIYYEAYKDEHDARRREKNLRLRSRAFTQLKIRITESLKN